ncbi:hypothetical protein ABGV42_01645 [Paenibacillus pabuli]
MEHSSRLIVIVVQIMDIFQHIWMRVLMLMYMLMTKKFIKDVLNLKLKYL